MFGGSSRGWIGAAVAASMAVAATVAGSGPAAANPEEGTRIDEFAAVADGGSMAVTGQAAFVDVPVVVGEDPVGDAVLPVPPTIGEPSDTSPRGQDLTTASIARTNPFEDVLTFTVGVANPPDSIELSTTVVYRWRIFVGGQGPSFELEAANTGQLARPDSLEPIFRIIEGVYSGTAHSSSVGYYLGDSVVAEVQGAMAGGVIQWQVPMDLVNAQAGSTITSTIDGTSIGVRAMVGVVGGPQPSISDSISALDMAAYTVPGPTVRFGIALAGTPAESVELTASADVEADGSFSGSVSAPAEPGEYIVVAEACYGAGNCGAAATIVTVS